DIGVPLDQDTNRHHQEGQQHEPGDKAGKRGHRRRPLRIRLITPSITSRMTVTSPMVSNPRKSARMTVTMSLPCARGVSWVNVSITWVVAAGRESTPQTTKNAITPTNDATTMSRRVVNRSAAC